MYITGKLAIKILLVFSLLSLFSCANTGNSAPGKFAPAGSYAAEEPSILEITKPYSGITLSKSLVLFHELLNSYDYFNQFTWGDYIFEDYLTVIYGLVNYPFDTGSGTEISVYDNNGRVLEKVVWSVIETNGKGEVWWQTEHSKEGDGSIFYEVLTNRFSVPVSVKFRNTETGKAFSRDTMFGESVRDAMLSMSDDEIQAKLDEERGEDAAAKLLPVYENLKTTGVETVEAGGRKIEAVHYQSSVAEGGGSGTLDVWYNPDLPHGIVRIILNKKTVAEITGWIEGAERKITEDSPHELPAYSTGNNKNNEKQLSSEAYSEGTVQNPVKLNTEEVWEGSVEPEGISYYFFEVPSRGDITCTVSGFSGLAELYYFGSDSSFSNWKTGSEGGELDFQEYAAEKGDLLYFTVNDLSDNYSKGESFYIDIQLDPLLDPLGVRMLNEFRNDPETLEKGKNRIKASGSDVMYFIYEADAGGDAELVIEDIDNENEKFYFIDVEEGSFSSSEYAETSNTQKIRITGLEKGARLYFYLVRKEELKNKKINITIK